MKINVEEKKFKFTIIFVLLLITLNPIYAQKMDSKNLELGVCLDYRAPLGIMNNFNTGNIGGGIEVFYHFPVKTEIPLGASFHVEFESPFEKANYIESWFTLNVYTGIWSDFTIIKNLLNIRVELGFGLANNFVEAPSTNVSGPYVDTITRISGIFIYSPDFMSKHNLSFNFGINYTLMPEIDNTGHYLGGKAAIIYSL